MSDKLIEKIKALPDDADSWILWLNPFGKDGQIRVCLVADLKALAAELELYRRILTKERVEVMFDGLQLLANCLSKDQQSRLRKVEALIADLRKVRDGE